MEKHLLILGCSERKHPAAGPLPALNRYDGSAWRTLRTYLRTREWPRSLEVGVLSAEHGLMGVMDEVEPYNTVMTSSEAARHRGAVTAKLLEWSKPGQPVTAFLGSEYRKAIDDDHVRGAGVDFRFVPGQIGEKLSVLKKTLEGLDTSPVQPLPERQPGTTYFLPDWDDMLDPAFDFSTDAYSGATPVERGDLHCTRLMSPQRMCDGILVSLAQHFAAKGVLRRYPKASPGQLSPRRLRDHFGLHREQLLFGDCGAFSYVAQEIPTICVDQAVALYDCHGFDFGASVDHIPVEHTLVEGHKRTLTNDERLARVQITENNARDFLAAHAKMKARFVPVGTVQALEPEEYGPAALRYVEMGYRHLALGGLVPRSDNDVLAIARAVNQALTCLRQRPWVHLFGVYRPLIREDLKSLQVHSFDSATYFRKSWLRSDQNYLAPNGKWYAALRVPMTSDGRTRQRLEAFGKNLNDLQVQEWAVLDLLTKFETHDATVHEVLDALLAYDENLQRSSETKSLREKYKQTLLDRPWLSCGCPFCQQLGIHMLVFRGSNRNKRRGAHNTLMLYKALKDDGAL